MAPKVFLSPDQVQEIIRLYKSGWTLERIAPLYNSSSGLLSKIMRRNNVPRNRYNRIRIDLRKVKPEQEPEVIALYNQGFSSTKIAVRFNASNNVILKVLRDNNIKIRNTNYKK
jgi:intein-encoded DNA endonuclease-like protein